MSVVKEWISSFFKSVKFNAIEVYCFYFQAALINAITTKKREFSKIERIERSRKGGKRYHPLENTSMYISSRIFYCLYTVKGY